MKYAEIYKQIEELESIATNRGIAFYELTSNRSTKNEALYKIDYQPEGPVLSFSSSQHPYDHISDFTVPIKFLEMSEDQWNNFIEGIEDQYNKSKAIGEKNEAKRERAAKMAQLKALKKELGL